MVFLFDDLNVWYIEKYFFVCWDEKVIDDVRNCVVVYEDFICYYYEMVEMVIYKDSIVNKFL